MKRLVLLLLLLATPAVGANVDDFDPLGDEWHGLRDFVSTAEAMGIEVEVLSTLNYSELDSRDRLVFVYPQTPLSGPSLGDFVSSGGRVLLFDDFGKSEEFLERLEITRVVPTSGNFPHDSYADGKSAFPIFRPEGRHALLEGVNRVVANHPAVLTNPGGAVIGYSAGGALVYDMNLGQGKAIVVADASLVINQMLGVADNAQFARNALDYLCVGERPCRVYFVVGSFESEGTYSGSGVFGDGSINDGIDAVNELIEKAMGEVLSELLFYLSVLLAIGIGGYLVSVLPMRPTRPYSAYVTDFFSRIPTPQSEFDWNIARFGKGSRNTNHALPMSILKETFEQLFLNDLGFWPSTASGRPGIESLADSFATKYLGNVDSAQRDALKRQTLELLGIMATIPPRNRVFLDSDAHFSQADLLRTHRKVMQTLSLMGLEDDYKRRASGDF